MASAAPRPDAARPRLTLGQTMVLQGVIPIVLVGLLLPVGLTAFFLALENASMHSAFDRGELFLAAANSAFTGCVALMASRHDSAYAMIMSFIVMLFFVLPGYAGWALLMIQQLLHKPYSTDVATVVGGIAAAMAMIIALVFVRLSYRPG